MIYLTNNYFKHEKRGERERGKKEGVHFFYIFEQSERQTFESGF